MAHSAVRTLRNGWGRGGGARKGDVRLFENNPGTGWIAEDADLPRFPGAEDFLHVTDPRTMPFYSLPTVMSALAHNGVDTFIGVGRTGHYMVGNNALEWGATQTVDGFITTDNINNIACDGVVWVLGTSTGKNRVSIDNGGSWIATTTNIGSVRGLLHANGWFTAATSTGIWFSQDGMVWTRRTASTLYMGIIHVTGDIYIAWTAADFYRSTDGANTFTLFVTTPTYTKKPLFAAYHKGVVLAVYEANQASGWTGIGFVSHDLGESWATGRWFSTTVWGEGKHPLAAVGVGNGFYVTGEGGRNAYVELGGLVQERAPTSTSDRHAAYVLGPYLITLSSVTSTNIAYAEIKVGGFPIEQKPAGKYVWKAYTKL